MPSTVPASGMEIPEDSRDSVFQSTVAVQGINPTLVDRSSQEEQSSHSLLGNRFAALIDEEVSVARKLEEMGEVAARQGEWW